jgi:dGTPase
MKIHSSWKEAEECYGCLSHLKTIGSRRKYPCEEDEDRLCMRNPFQSDKSKLLLSKAYRVLWKKTQVFSIPESPLVRTRMTHVMEVVANCITISELLGLNTDLVEAAAIGHDIGHVPYGHPGEEWMKKNLPGLADFCHERMGVITAQKIERAGRGLNLTWHTLEAMMCHSGNMAKEGMSQEAWVVNYGDKITYLFHDYNDIYHTTRGSYPWKPAGLEELVESFGSNQRE